MVHVSVCLITLDPHVHLSHLSTRKAFPSRARPTDFSFICLMQYACAAEILDVLQILAMRAMRAMRLRQEDLFRILDVQAIAILPFQVLSSLIRDS